MLISSVKADSMTLPTGAWYATTATSGRFKFATAVTTRGFDPGTSSWAWYDLAMGSGTSQTSFIIAPTNTYVSISELYSSSNQFVATATPSASAILSITPSGYSEPYFNKATGLMTSLTVGRYDSTNKKLTYVVAISSGSIVIEFNCGSTGNPTDISGEIESTYNDVSTVLTVTSSSATIVLDWSTGTTDGGDTGGVSGGTTGGVSPPEGPLIPPSLPPLLPDITPSIDWAGPAGIGAGAVVAIILGAIVYGETSRKKQTPRNVWKTPDTSLEIDTKLWNKPVTKIKWDEHNPHKKKTKWRRKKSFD